MFTDNLVTATRRVQRYLLIVAFIFFARDFILLYLANALSGDLVSMSLVVPAFFIGLMLLARSKPLLASIIALALFAGIVVLTWGPNTQLFGWIVNSVALICLLLAISNARDAERAKAGLRM